MEPLNLNLLRRILQVYISLKTGELRNPFRVKDLMTAQGTTIAYKILDYLVKKGIAKKNIVDAYEVNMEKFRLVLIEELKKAFGEFTQELVPAQ
jgi:nucleoside-triphosphatase THEP1